MGGGVTFNPKIYIAGFGNFKHGFLSMKSIQKRVSGFHTKEPVPWKNEAGSARQKEGHGEACLEIRPAEERIHRLHMCNWENILIFCLPFWFNQRGDTYR